jgi:hypothetical protein
MMGMIQDPRFAQGRHRDHLQEDNSTTSSKVRKDRSKLILGEKNPQVS